MLEFERLLLVRCPSCEASLEGDREVPVSIDSNEVSVSVCCEGCEKKVCLTVGPVPPDGRRMEVDVDVV